MSRRRLHQRQRRVSEEVARWWKITNGPEELMCSPTQDRAFAERMAETKGHGWHIEPTKGPR